MKARMDVFNKVFLFLLHQMSTFVVNLTRSILRFTLVPQFCEGSDAPVWKLTTSCQINITNIYRVCGWALTQAHIVRIHSHISSHSNATICVRLLSDLQKGGDRFGEAGGLAQDFIHRKWQTILKPRAIISLNPVQFSLEGLGENLSVRKWGGKLQKCLMNTVMIKVPFIILTGAIKWWYFFFSSKTNYSVLTYFKISEFCFP